MELDIECWCGDALDTRGKIHETEADLTADCLDCGRRYVITITQLELPSQD